MTLAGQTLFISGGSRGIGLAIAIRAARDGANVALIAKTAEPHPKPDPPGFSRFSAPNAASVSSRSKGADTASAVAEPVVSVEVVIIAALRER